MASYAPDGGWAEGPGYWHYATRYTAYLLAGLNTALGTDFGLSDSPGFDRAGIFRIDFAGPSGKTFNYADGSDALEPAEELFWLARRFSQPVNAWQQTELLRERTRAHALDLVWYQDKTQSPAAAGLPLHTAYSAINAAFLRSSWDDRCGLDWRQRRRQRRQSCASGPRNICARCPGSTMGARPWRGRLQSPAVLRPLALDLLSQPHGVA